MVHRPLEKESGSRRGRDILQQFRREGSQDDPAARQSQNERGTWQLGAKISRWNKRTQAD